MIRATMSMTLPRAAQNSLSPYHSTARMLIKLDCTSPLSVKPSHSLSCTQMIQISLVQGYECVSTGLPSTYPYKMMTIAIIPPAGTTSPIISTLDSISRQIPWGEQRVRQKLTPIVNHQVARSHFKGYQGGLKNEEIPASRESKCFVDIPPCETDKGARYWQISNL